jgi:Flp pilus assembly protein TadG
MTGLWRLAARPRGDRSTGQALVEFAMVLPMFVFMLLILFDFGRVVYTQHTITEDTREGVRQGAAAPDLRLNDGVTTPQDLYDAIRTAALRLSQGTGIGPGQVTGETGACTGAATPDTVSPTTCFYPDGFDVGGRVVVKITTEVQIITPIISSLVGGSYTVTAESVAFMK